jgi:ankyrin repeat protein
MKCFHNDPAHMPLNHKCSTMTDSSDLEKEHTSSDDDTAETNDELGETPLMEAARWGHIDLVRKLIESGAVVNATTTEMWTALHAACVGEHSKIVELLLTHKSNPNIYSCHRNYDEEFGWHFSGTPLHITAVNGNVSVAELLLAAGAMVSPSWDLDLRTPIFYAAAYGHHEIISCLCKHGANPKFREHRHSHGCFLDYTPLHYAADNGHLKAVEVLLACGAEPRAIESNSSQTALQMARASNHIDVAKLLRAKKK